MRALDAVRRGLLAGAATRRWVAVLGWSSWRAVPLGQLPAASRRTGVVPGHQPSGIPPEALDVVETYVEIPMVGTGASVDVAVAGWVVLYRLAGLP